ncbi:MAG: glycosyltransferase [Candidatus Eisenbacteria bacterium]
MSARPADLAAPRGAASSGSPRVLLLIDSLGRAGAEKQAQLLASRLPAHGIVTRLACFQLPPAAAEQLRGAGVTIDRLHAAPRRLWPPRVLLDVARIVRRHRIDIVQTFLPTFDILAPCLKPVLPGVRIVTSRRNVDDQLDARRLRLLRLTGRFADVVVGNAERVAESVRRLEPGSRARIVVIGNGIENEPAIGRDERESARRALEAGARPTISYLAHFRPGKGYEHLPEVIEAVRRASPDLLVLIAGDETSNRQYRQTSAAFRSQIAERGIENAVRFLGLVAGARETLAASDLLLSLSDVEGMSNSVMEAMLLGLPVVATDAGGAGELIEPGVSGEMVARGDAAGAAERIAALLRDPARRASIGEQARRRILDRFSADRMAAAYARLYREIALR